MYNQGVTTKLNGRGHNWRDWAAVFAFSRHGSQPKVQFLC